MQLYEEIEIMLEKKQLKSLQLARDKLPDKNWLINFLYTLDENNEVFA